MDRSVVFIAGLLLGAVALGNLRCGDRGGTPVITGDTLYENKTGKPGTAGLPDGSRVVLGAHTSIRLSKTFGQGQRELELDGEALFDIVPNAGKPFIIHTRLLLIEIVGAVGGDGAGRSSAKSEGGSPTRFRADAHRENAGEEVDLLEGRLRVRKSYHSDTDNEAELLNTGEMVMINKDIDLMEKEKLDSTDWKRLKEMR
jgi:transmembrane sensor